MCVNRLRSTAAVIRSYCNPNITKQVSNLLSYGIGLVVVAVHSREDRESTRGYLGDLANHIRVRVIEIQEGYTWSNALNRAMMSIKMSNLDAASKNQIKFILNCSVEVLLKKEQLAAMLDAASNDPDCGVVGTTHQGLLNSNPVSLGRSYDHPRNTCMLIRVETFSQCWGMFDSRCDDIGGMEDIDFVLGMLATTSLHYVMLNLQVPLVVGIHYDQTSKEEREQLAMDMIFAHWRSLFKENSPERTRIDQAIKTMQLEL